MMLGPGKTNRSLEWGTIRTILLQELAGGEKGGKGEGPRGGARGGYLVKSGAQLNFGRAGIRNRMKATQRRGARKGPL